MTERSKNKTLNVKFTFEIIESKEGSSLELESKLDFF